MSAAVGGIVSMFFAVAGGAIYRAEMSPTLHRRWALLVAALAALRVKSREPELALVHSLARRDRKMSRRRGPITAPSSG